MLATIRNLARLPQLAVDASGAVVDIAQRVAALQLIVADRLAALDRAVEEVLVVLPAVADDLRGVRATVVPVEEGFAAVLASVARLAATSSACGRSPSRSSSLPDPDAPGPIARARDALTGRA
jgi:hypothetical protein